MMKINVMEFTVKDWARYFEQTNEESLKDAFVEAYGKEVKCFYANRDSAVAGCQFTNGTFAAFGCGIDMNNISYDEMVEAIACGL